MKQQLILGIESSCDETSAAVVRDGREVLSNVVASQLIHADYGGVVPELASREHLRAIVPVVREAMHRAGLSYADLDAIAVTEGPGLAGALLVGITFAKSLAFAADKPLIAVNHLEGHIHAVLMDAPFPDADRILALVVSGGHTHLYLATRNEGVWTYRNVGKTLDDAAGEAFDKAAKLLGLPYPGGPWMDALAAHGTADTTLFPFAQIKQKATGNTAPKLARELAALKGTGFSPYISTSAEDGAGSPGLQPRVPTEGESARRFDMSFSGIKTAVRRYVELHNMRDQIIARTAALRELGLDKSNPRDHLPATNPGAPGPDSGTLDREGILTHFDTETLNLIASFQNAVVKNLARSTFRAAEHYGARGLLISGGVSANSHLRRVFTAAANDARLPIAFPTVALSTDNAAMIAAAAFPKLLAHDFAPDTLEPTPQLRLG